jgi:hypothetical protein
VSFNPCGRSGLDDECADLNRLWTVSNSQFEIMESRFKLVSIGDRGGQQILSHRGFQGGTGLAGQT